MSFIQLQKAGRGEKPTTYVTLAVSQRTPGKKHPHQIRTHLGCLTPDGNDVVVSKLFAGTSHVHVPLKALKDVAVQGEAAVLQWLKQQVPDENSNCISTVCKPASDKVSLIKKVGITHLLETIATSLGLDEVLATSFNCQGGFDGSALLYLAYYQVAERRPLYQAYAWMNEHAVPDAINNYDLSSTGTSRLTIRIGKDTAAFETFFRLWIKKLNAPSSLIFDTTSVSSYSENLDFAEWGYNRDCESLPQVNISLVSSREASLPLYYRVLPGSIPDVTSLKVTIELLKELGIKDYTSSLDRGFYSSANIRSMLENSIGFVLGASQSSAQTKQLIKKHQDILRSPRYSIEHNGNIVRHAVDKWTVDMGKGEETKELDAHIYWDYTRQSVKEKDLECKLFQWCFKSRQDMPQGFATKEEAALWIKENAKNNASLLHAVMADTKWIIERDTDAIELCAANKGFTVVLTTKRGASGVEILDDYRSRDKVEKLFDILKNENGMHRLNSGNHHAVLGRLFIAFIATIIHTVLENRMKKANLLKKYSVSELLAVVRKLESVTMESGNEYMMEITKAQREIFKALEIPIPTV